MRTTSPSFSLTSASGQEPTLEDCEWTIQAVYSMVVRPLRFLSSRSRSVLRGRGPPSREGCAEGGGAGRQRCLLHPSGGRPEQAPSVTARRPPCQRVGLETAPEPSGSSPFASNSQVRRGRAGCREPAAHGRGAKPLGTPRSSPCAVLLRLRRLCPLGEV